ncbi:VOC family protein [Chromobacterium sp. IIBBL 290-4]|uniref:VOC family protein n=1 Tax=Chromobacterium sp. IIBBL 290-4 TaxID=2953890 RepID=UPI0020B79775|nr:VOC family protein [Chromobacterium sp. IIBBL 290-4]UTH74951.1 VOC family protein [Chromobacterium sp. IIBBL 290-4]
MHVYPYLNFNGRAEEALNFYRDALSGEIAMLMRYGDAPESAPDMGEPNPDWIMHARLVFGPNVLMISDTSQPMAPTPQITLSINLEGDADKARKVFAALSVGGKVTMDLHQTFWGALFGCFSDRFGVCWMVNCQL